MRVEYRVPGPLEVLSDGVPVTVPAGRCRVLLARLLLRPNKFLSPGELVERLWDAGPPAPGRAHKTLHVVVMRRRQALGRYAEAEENHLRSAQLQATSSHRHYQADEVRALPARAERPVRPQ